MADRSSTSAIAFETCRDLASFSALEPEWTRLHRRAKGEYFQSFGFCHSSLVTEPPDARRALHCIVGRRRGQAVVIWPLMTSSKACWKFAEALTPPNESPSDMLVAPEADAEAIVEAAWREAIRATRADVFKLWRVRRSSLLYAFFQRNAMIRSAMDENTPIADLRREPAWDAFCRSRPGRERNAPDYLKRRLAKQGEFALERIDARDGRLPALVEWFVTQKRKWASDKSIASRWTFSDESPAFWKSILARDATDADGFHLFVLSLKGEPIAVNIVAVGGERAYLVANTYDLDHKKLSPGVMLVDECVKWAFERRLDFDFGSGEQRYKTSWSAGDAYGVSSFIVCATAWGQTGFMTRQFARHASERVSHVVGRVVRRPAVATESPSEQ
jgi:CelD/BcsL family acetyltransferase involved in cellulose biosynthesis